MQVFLGIIYGFVVLVLVLYSLAFRPVPLPQGAGSVGPCLANVQLITVGTRVY